MSTQSRNKRLFSETLKSLMKKVPFDQITVDDICEHADISRRTFYRHFKDKYDLLNWTYDNEFSLSAIKSPDKTIWDYTPYIFRYFYDNREFINAAFDVKGQNSFRSYCTEKLHPIMMNDFGHVFANKEEADFVITHLCEGTFDAFQIWLSSEPCMTPEEYHEYFREKYTSIAKGISEIGKMK